MMAEGPLNSRCSAAGSPTAVIFAIKNNSIIILHYSISFVLVFGNMIIHRKSVVIQIRKRRNRFPCSFNYYNIRQQYNITVNDRSFYFNFITFISLSSFLKYQSLIFRDRYFEFWSRKNFMIVILTSRNFIKKYWNKFPVFLIFN